MKTEFKLDEKRMMYLDKTKTYTDKRVLCYKEEDVKEKIQKAKERLKEEEQKLIEVYEKGKLNDLDEFVIKLNKKREKIFLEEFGEKLI